MGLLKGLAISVCLVVSANAAAAQSCQHVGAMTNSQYHNLIGDMAGGGYLILMRHSQKGSDALLTGDGRAHLVKYRQVILDLPNLSPEANWAAPEDNRVPDEYSATTCNRVRETGHIVMDVACSGTKEPVVMRASTGALVARSLKNSHMTGGRLEPSKNHFIAVNSGVINAFFPGGDQDFGCAEAMVVKKEGSGNYICPARFFLNELSEADSPEEPSWMTKPGDTCRTRHTTRSRR